ncbi:type IV secretory system conjugative DNA transfer family protein [bacterium]|nr:type IV secretory system conjugative DNA transfer family protein [bacterium]
MTTISPRPDLLEDLPRGKHRESVGTPPQAYFEAAANLAATPSLQFEAERNPHAKLFLGVVEGEVVTGNRQPDGRLPRHVAGGVPLGLMDDRHHVLIAGSRAGKGRAVLLPNLLSLPANASLLCIDPKGELARLTVPWRADKLHQPVGVLDPFDVSGPGTQRHRIALNPLDALDPGNPRTFVPNAKLQADSVIVSGDFKDRHWDDTSKQMLGGLLLHVRTYERYAGVRDLVTVWHLAAELATPDLDQPSRYWVEQEMLSNDAAGGMIRNAARQFYDRTGGEFSSVLSNLRKHLDFLGIECMRECLTGPSVDLRDLKRKSLALYVTLPAMRMSELSGWLRMIVQLAIAAHEEEPQQSGPATLMLLDEFHVLGKLTCLETAAAQMAGLGLKIFTVLQDLGQLKSRYPQGWETFIGNAGCLQTFGLADQTTLDYVSQRLGETATLSRSTQLPGFDQATQQGLSGESWSLGVHRLLTAEEVGRYFARDDHKLRQLILRPGHRPAILQRAYYDQHELFRERSHGS